MSSDNGRHPASRAQIDTSPLTELEAAENEITSSSDATRIPIYIVPMICSWTSPPRLVICFSRAGRIGLSGK